MVSSVVVAVAGAESAASDQRVVFVCFSRVNFVFFFTAFREATKITNQKSPKRKSGCKRTYFEQQQKKNGYEKFHTKKNYIPNLNEW